MRSDLKAQLPFADYYRTWKDWEGQAKKVEQMRKHVIELIGAEQTAEHDKWLDAWIDRLQADPETSINAWRFKADYWEACEAALYDLLRSVWANKTNQKIALHAGDRQLICNLREIIYDRECLFLNGFGNCFARFYMEHLASECKPALSLEEYDRFKEARSEYIAAVCAKIEEDKD